MLTWPIPMTSSYKTFFFWFLFFFFGGFSSSSLYPFLPLSKRALVLLDEGDALVERRQRGQFLINSMSAVLLRLLEGFSGALFITSNRAAAFDPAALSRVTLAIRFPSLDTAGKRQVWRGWLVRVFAAELVSGVRRSRRVSEAYVDARFDLDALAQFSGSGRSVGACVRLAIALADERQAALSNEVLNDAITVWSSFWRDLDDEGVAHSWDVGNVNEEKTPTAASTAAAAADATLQQNVAASAQAFEPNQIAHLTLDALQSIGIGIKLGVALCLAAAATAALRKGP